MTDVLAISLHSMQQDMGRLERISLNMANAMTPGYKREVAMALPSGAGAFAAAVTAAEVSARGRQAAGARSPPGRAAAAAGARVFQTAARPGTQ